METTKDNEKNQQLVDNLNKQIDTINQKVDISYPTLWKYKVIGTDEIKVKNCIMTILKNKEHTINHSKNSKGGKYTSLALEVMVDCEDDRVNIYEAIRTHKDIKMVL